eukprot:1421-Chlamydomonas_euryale.AAC.5
MNRRHTFRCTRTSPAKRATTGIKARARACVTADAHPPPGRCVCRAQGCTPKASYRNPLF